MVTLRFWARAVVTVGMTNMAAMGGRDDSVHEAFSRVADDGVARITCAGRQVNSGRIGA